MLDYGLKDRVVIITGATGGIGSAMATEFYKQGSQVVLIGRAHDKLTALHDKLVSIDTDTTYTLEPFCIQTDLTAIEATKSLIQETAKKFGRIDVVINNAARLDSRLFLRSDMTFLQNMTHINFIVPYNLCKNALPYMLKNEYGRIINLTSIAGVFGDAGTTAYAASKGAVASFTKSLAAEYGKRGITANCIAPGVINTDATKKIPLEMRQELLKSTPAQRFGNPEEVAYLAAFLASERAAYINGQQIQINGGLVR